MKILRYSCHLPGGPPGYKVLGGPFETEAEADAFAAAQDAPVLVVCPTPPHQIKKWFVYEPPTSAMGGP